MIVLDTNVLSEPLKPVPDGAVVRWLDAQDPGTLWLPCISLAEILSGVEILPIGRRQTRLKQAVVEQIGMLFRGRILPFDDEAARMFAIAYAAAQSVGNTISFPDCAIAAIARVHGYLVATRNVGDFRGTGVKVLDPWSE